MNESVSSAAAAKSSSPLNHSNSNNRSNYNSNDNSGWGAKSEAEILLDGIASDAKTDSEYGFIDCQKLDKKVCNAVSDIGGRCVWSGKSENCQPFINHNVKKFMNLATSEDVEKRNKYLEIMKELKVYVSKMISDSKDNQINPAWFDVIQNSAETLAQDKDFISRIYKRNARFDLAKKKLYLAKIQSDSDRKRRYLEMIRPLKAIEEDSSQNSTSKFAASQKIIGLTQNMQAEADESEREYKKAQPIPESDATDPWLAFDMDETHWKHLVVLCAKLYSRVKILGFSIGDQVTYEEMLRHRSEVYGSVPKENDLKPYFPTIANARAWWTSLAATIGDPFSKKRKDVTNSFELEPSKSRIVLENDTDRTMAHAAVKMYSQLPGNAMTDVDVHHVQSKIVSRNDLKNSNNNGGSSSTNSLAPKDVIDTVELSMSSSSASSAKYGSSAKSSSSSSSQSIFTQDIRDTIVSKSFAVISKIHDKAIRDIESNYKTFKPLAQNLAQTTFETTISKIKTRASKYKNLPILRHINSKALDNELSNIEKQIDSPRILTELSDLCNSAFSKTKDLSIVHIEESVEVCKKLISKSGNNQQIIEEELAHLREARNEAISKVTLENDNTRANVENEIKEKVRKLLKENNEELRHAILYIIGQSGNKTVNQILSTIKEKEDHINEKIANISQKIVDMSNSISEITTGLEGKIKLLESWQIAATEKFKTYNMVYNSTTKVDTRQFGKYIKDIKSNMEQQATDLNYFISNVIYVNDTKSYVSIDNALDSFFNEGPEVSVDILERVYNEYSSVMSSLTELEKKIQTNITESMKRLISDTTRDMLELETRIKKSMFDNLHNVLQHIEGESTKEKTKSQLTEWINGLSHGKRDEIAKNLYDKLSNESKNKGAGKPNMNMMGYIPNRNV